MATDNVTQRILAGIGNEIGNQWLGADDFSRVLSKLQEGNILGSLKSGLTGTLELGGTLAALLGAPFSGGGSLAARGAIAGGTRLATKAPRIAKALQGTGKARQAASALSGKPRQQLIEKIGPLSSLQDRMMLAPRSYLKTPTDAMRSAGRNPLRALGIIDPYFNYKNLGTVGTGRVGSMLPRSAGAYTRGLARASGIVPFAGQGLPAFAIQRSVVPKIFGAFLEGPPSDIGEGIVRTGVNQLADEELEALLAAADLGPMTQAPSALESYLRGTPQ